MKKFATGGFIDNKTHKLLMHGDCEFVGETIVPHTSKKLNETIHKTIKDLFPLHCQDCGGRIESEFFDIERPYGLQMSKMRKERI